MSKEWTQEELQMASKVMKESGNMSYEEFCDALHEGEIVTIEFKAKGVNRKALATAISEISGAEVIYMKAPTYAYTIGEITIAREGTLVTENRELADHLIIALADRGFHAAGQAPVEPKHPQTKLNVLSIELPKESLPEAALANLDRIIEAKGNLIKKAIGIDSLAYEVEDDRIRFPWFSFDSSAEEVQAYMHLMSGLVEMVRNTKRITAKEKAVENEKYTFRCFLLRLGMIGDEYKISRKILLRNLKGNAAWKNK